MDPKEKELEQREALLKSKEEELKQREVEVEAREEEVEEFKNAKERLYDKINIPIKYLDIFIGICVAAIVVLTVMGMLKGRGYF